MNLNKSLADKLNQPTSFPAARSNKKNLNLIIITIIILLYIKAVNIADQIVQRTKIHTKFCNLQSVDKINFTTDKRSDSRVDITTGRVDPEHGV